ncbi:MAG: hypothetical protein A2X94_10420 [Bdellovibrionales bacterium GWB1_55_8]|nr:MAG: hypothetical protein A2X94_10420 [Bdellovibrionales bacterium GWB1_55_8]
MISTNRKLQWSLAIALIILPAVIGISRSWTVSAVVKNRAITTVQPEARKPARQCSADLCTQEAHFRFSGLPENGQLSIGYYGAFADSWVRINDHAFDEIKSRAELRMSWFEFRMYRLPALVSPTSNAWDVTVISASPIGTRKLGMSTPHVFVGPSQALETLRRLFEFYNIHLYLLAALILCGLQIFIWSARTSSRTKNSGAILPFALTVAALLSYSHYFDSILIGLGASVSLIEGLPRMFWGPAIFAHVLKRKSTMLAALALYAALVFPGLVDWPSKDLFFAVYYKWVVTGTSAIAIITILRNWRDLSLLSPFSLLLISDTLVIQGIAPLLGGLYLSPLGLFALPVVKNLPSILSLLHHNYFWHKRNQLTAELNKLRIAAPASATPEWKDLLYRMAQQLSKSTGAERISICYLGLDSPLIVGSSHGKRIEFQDGQLPPVFARVIQTDEAIWWSEEGVFNKGLSRSKFGQKDGYKSDIATVLPIRVNNEVYGAVSLTDFSNPGLIRADTDLRTYLEEVILSYRDLLSAQLVRRKEVASASYERVTAKILKNFSERAPFLSSAPDAARLFLEHVTQEFPVMGMYFEYHADTERLELLSSVGMSPGLEALWQGIPFRARPTNRLSPFAISINERRGIFINDIRVYYSLLAAPSVNVLEASQVRGFVTAPVCLGDKVLGLVCLLQRSDQEFFAPETPKILEMPTHYLAYHLEQLHANQRLSAAERVIGRFADPALIRALGNASADQPILAGGTFSGPILVQDMRGSTDASRRENDPAALAIKLSTVYGVAGKLANRFGGTFDKGNGDGLITTLSAEPGNGEALPLCLHYLDEVFEEARKLLGVAETIVIAHRGTLYRGVMGNLQRIAWDTCGRDLVDAFAIEKSAKQVPGIVLAISSAFLSAEAPETREFLMGIARERIQVSEMDGEVHLFDRSGVAKIHEWLFARVRAA